MVKEEILEGLRLSVMKGEPLRKAMMSFYNAGYTKKDIEEAALALNAMPVQQRTPQQTPAQPIITSTEIQNPQNQPQAIPPPQPAPQIQPVQPVQPVQFVQPQFKQMPAQIFDPRFQSPMNVIQRVSEYGQKPNAFGLVITFVLIFFLLFLLGILVAVFLFKDELSSIFGGFI